MEYLPANYDSRDNWPLLIWHHGRGKGGNGSSNDLNKIANSHIMNWLKSNDVPFVVLAPQDGTGFFGAGRMNTFYEWAKGYYGSKTDENSYHISVLSASGGGLGFIVSENSLAVQEVATITSNASIIGSGNATMYNNIVNSGLKMWFHHGSGDNTTRYGPSLNFYKGLVNLIGGPDFTRYRFTMYDGLGHSAWSEVYDNSGRTRRKWVGQIENGGHGDYYNWTDESWYDWMIANSREGAVIPPTVNAGSDITLNLPVNSTNLSGSATSLGGEITNYSWTKINGPSSFSIQNATGAVATVTNLVEGIYVFQLTVTDNVGQTASDDVTIIVNQVNQTPTVSIADEFVITLPINSISISSTSSDSDGNIVDRLWTQRSGPSTAALTGQTTSQLTATDLLEGEYIFRLTVTDNVGASAFSQTTVENKQEIVNQSPVANAGEDITINLPTSSVSISGQGSDVDGAIISYQWNKISGPSTTLLNDTTNTLLLQNLLEGVYVFELTVTDDDMDTGSDVVQVFVVQSNQSPVANAGSDISITLPTNQALLNGTGNDPDGSIISYNWIQQSGPAIATLSNSNSPTLTVGDLIEGEFIFELTVMDNDSAQNTDDARIIVDAATVNNPPLANAGEDIEIVLPVNSVIINGSGTDNDGFITSYHWSKVSGPSSFVIANQDSSVLELENLVAGNYTFQLQVTDNMGASSTDEVSIIVGTNVVNQSPTVSIGNDLTIRLPLDSIEIVAIANDPDGTIDSVAWNQLSGPQNMDLTIFDSLIIKLNNLTAGIYTFSITVFDDKNASASDEISLHVISENLFPVVDAGTNITLTLPEDSLLIIGQAFDPDGTITSSSWSKIAGPEVSIINIGDSLILNDLLEGIYEFEFRAIDNEDSVSFDYVSITVIGVNLPPIVTVQNNTTVQLPTSITNLEGWAFDSDGSISAVLWEQISGPAVTISNDSSTVVSLQNLVEGIYQFRFTAWDDEMAFTSATITLTVLAQELNNFPVADAGSDIILTLPTNITIINGSGTDTDGFIVSYLWTKTSGPTALLVNDTTPKLTVQQLIEGTYIFRLTVTDDKGAQNQDEVKVIVKPADINQTPTSNAGEDISLNLPLDFTTLNGSGFDPDGQITAYLWNQVSGPSNAITTDLTKNQLQISELIEGIYTFSLQVTDNDGAVDIDVVLITVLPIETNIPPVANAGEDIELFLPTNSITIYGEGIDPDGSIVSYRWRKVSGPSGTSITNQQTPAVTVGNLNGGTHVYELTVSDNDGALASDRIQVRVLEESINQSPIVDAGQDKEIILPLDSLTLSGNASDLDGRITFFFWKKLKGPPIQFEDSTKLVTKVSGLVNAYYEFELTVFDDDSASNSDIIQINVLPENSNISPEVSAGSDLTFILPEDTILIQGEASDPDGFISQHIWEKVQGPSVTLINPDNPDLRLTNATSGNYLFELTVIDDGNQTASDRMQLTVLPESTNINPEVDAGEDIIADENEERILISAIASDENGTIALYKWTKLDGPDAEITGINTSNLIIKNFNVGLYSFQIEVTDNQGGVASDIVNLTVVEVPEIFPPRAIVGSDTALIIPNDSIMLEGSAESENLIESYSWKQIYGPKVDGFPADTNQILLRNLMKGEYLFELTVMDNFNLTDSDDIAITVKDDVLENDFPKIFTPNGDGINDYWIVEDLDRVSGCPLTIYNQFGVIVFQVSEYENNWDGTTNGTPLDAGAYYFTFDCDGRDNITGGIRIIN